jgi:4-hydroxyphenylpyruvate dioxygenase
MVDSFSPNQKRMELTLWPACVRSLDFASQLKVAERAGFDSLAINVQVAMGLLRGGMSGEQVVQEACSHEVRLGHLDAVAGWLPQRYPSGASEEAKQLLDFSLDDALTVCRALDLRRMLAIAATDRGSISLAEIIRHFRELCDRARDLNVGVDLEFVPMWVVPDLRTAWTIVAESGYENCGIMFDTWHFLKGHASPDYALLREIPAELIVNVQVSDALSAPIGTSLEDECLHWRAVPGEGTLPLTKPMEIVRKKNVRSIGPEVYSDALDRLPPEEVGRRCAAGLERTLREAGFTL